MNRKAKIFLVGFYIDEPDGPILMNWHTMGYGRLVEKDGIWGYNLEELKKISKQSGTYYESLGDFLNEFNQCIEPVRRNELWSNSIRTSRDTCR